jgi:CBS domain-containing protein/mannitol/fructose-specific phosphotransferase system IIA component (Ntr-type)
MLSQYLPADHIVVPLRSHTFRDAVVEMVGGLVKLGVIRDRAALDAALASASGRDVVAIGSQVALPHFRTEAVDHLIVSLGIAKEPLAPGDSGLAVPPRIVALVIAPPEAATLYLQTVAALARFFQAPDVIRRLHEATAPNDVVNIPELLELKIQPKLTVRALMMRNVTTVSPDSKARSAVDIMIRTRERALPVVGDAGEVLGIITEWDVLRALVPHIPRVGEEFDETDPSVREIMTRSVLCVPEEMGLEEAVNLMINKKVEHCPVVRDSAFVGMLTRADIIRKLFAR